MKTSYCKWAARILQKQETLGDFWTQRYKTLSVCGLPYKDGIFANVCDLSCRHYKYTYEMLLKKQKKGV